MHKRTVAVVLGLVVFTLLAVSLVRAPTDGARHLGWQVDGSARGPPASADDLRRELANLRSKVAEVETRLRGVEARIPTIQRVESASATIDGARRDATTPLSRPASGGARPEAVRREAEPSPSVSPVYERRRVPDLRRGDRREQVVALLGAPDEELVEGEDASRSELRYYRIGARVTLVSGVLSCAHFFGALTSSDGGSPFENDKKRYRPSLWSFHDVEVGTRGVEVLDRLGEPTERSGLVVQDGEETLRYPRLGLVVELAGPPQHVVTSLRIDWTQTSGD